MNAFLRSRLGLAAIAAFLLLMVLLSSHGYIFTNQYLNSDNADSNHSLASDREALPDHPKVDSTATNASKVAVVSMLYGDNNFYVRAINTHLRHAERFGYPSYILRTEIIDGVWNKLAYMMHVMINEMQKGEQGAEWLMWFDADSAVVNAALPLDIFLPPINFDGIHLLASKDHQGFNAGMFFIRCHSWSLKLLANALTFPKYKPEVNLSFAEQTTLWIGMNETGNRAHVLWQPRIWWNTYQWHHGYEGEVGSLFVHFPGLEGDRWNHMGHWLDVLEGNGPEGGSKKWEVEYENTQYPKQVDEFWHAMRLGRQTLRVMHDTVINLANAPETVRVAIQRLEYVMGAETDKVDVVMKAVKQVKDAVDENKVLQQKDTG